MVKKLFAECMGTFGLVFFGCAAITINASGILAIPAAVIPLIFGLALAIMLNAMSHISGGHFNPAVTFALSLSREFKWNYAIVYWVAQIAGAIIAIALIKVLIPSADHVGANIPSSDISAFVAVLWEIVLTFFLVFVITSLATDDRFPKQVAGYSVGTVVALAGYVGGNFSGASLNPARSIAPALFETAALSSLWIYIVGPIIGASLGALFYKSIKS